MGTPKKTKGLNDVLPNQRLKMAEWAPELSQTYTMGES